MYLNGTGIRDGKGLEEQPASEQDGRKETVERGQTHGRPGWQVDQSPKKLTNALASHLRRSTIASRSSQNRLPARVRLGSVLTAQGEGHDATRPASELMG